MNEIRKPMQNMKEEINKDIEILKIINLKSIPQIKTSMEVWLKEWPKLNIEYQKQKIK
jgi:hypothetical protein